MKDNTGWLVTGEKDGACCPVWGEGWFGAKSSIRANAMIAMDRKTDALDLAKEARKQNPGVKIRVAKVRVEVIR